MTIFAFDHSRNALVYPGPDGRLRHFPVPDLLRLQVENRKTGDLEPMWPRLRAEDLRTALPRFDPPQVALAAPTDLDAIGRAVRGRRL